MMYPVDTGSWTKQKALVDVRLIDAINSKVRGAQASIRIAEAQPFDPDERRQALPQRAGETAPEMVIHTIGAGSSCEAAAGDAEGGTPDGSHSYRLHLPADPPATLFRSATDVSRAVPGRASLVALRLHDARGALRDQTWKSGA